MARSSPYLLDTNIVLAGVRNNALGQFLDATYDLSTARPGPHVSIVTVGELQAFAGKLHWGRAKQAALRSVLARLAIYDISDRFVPAYAAIDTASDALGHRMGKNDLWIAATARVLGLTVLTTDKDFDHLHPTWIDREWVDPASQLTP